VKFTEIKYNESGPTYGGVAVAAFGGGPVDFTDCDFSQIGRVGVLYWVNGTYTGCTYTGKGAGNWLDYAIDANAGAVIQVSESQVSDNLGVASSDGSTSAGYLVTTLYGSGTQAAFTGNTLTNNSTGIVVGYDGSDTALVTAHDNCFSGNTWGVSTTAPFVDAENNWWGDASGPTHASNPPGLGDAVDDKVDFSPWITDGCGGSSVDASWQNLRTSELNDLQSLLDSALAGDTIQFVGDTSLTYPLSVTPSVAGVTVDLNGGTFSGGSPWMTVSVADITVLGPGTLNGGGSTSDPAILVVSGGDNFRLEDVEVTGWLDGVHIQDPVESLKIIANWIHSNADNALQVDADPTGVVTIEGNLFKVNSGPGVEFHGSGSLDATYNSWGHIDGALAGDGIYGNVLWEPWTYVEFYLDMDPDTDASEVTVAESQIFDVKFKADAENLYGMSFEFTYDTSMLTLNSAPVFTTPWNGTGRCSPTASHDPYNGTLSYVCFLFQGLDPEWDALGGTILTADFTAEDNGGLTGNGPWDAYFDIEHLESYTSAAAMGGVKVFVNNAGFNAPSVPDRDITDTDDGVVHINGIAQFTGFIDLQGRGDDSGALLEVFDQQAISGSTLKADATSASSGAYTTEYDGSELLVIGNTYWFQVDNDLYLPTTVTYVSGPPATDYANYEDLDLRPLTGLNDLLLLGGDATDDDYIDINDASCIGGSFNSTSPPNCGGFGSSDVNNDGVVNILDLVLMGGNYLLDFSPWSQP
jgi:hypothetical protein